MKTAIRLDDITPDMDYTRFNRVREILKKAGIAPLAGVVPFNKDETLHFEEEHDDFVTLLSDLKLDGWCFALHGFNHVYTTKRCGLFPLNNFSEYAGVSYDTQLDMIKRGLIRLKELGITTELFMAPGHSYDNNTLRALRDCNITRMTDGFGSNPYTYKGITFYPIAKRRSDCVSDKEGYTTLVLHTNIMSDDEIDALEKMITEKREHFIDYRKYMEITPIPRTFASSVVEYLQAKGKFILVRLRGLIRKAKI